MKKTVERTAVHGLEPQDSKCMALEERLSCKSTPEALGRRGFPEAHAVRRVFKFDSGLLRRLESMDWQHQPCNEGPSGNSVPGPRPAG